MNIYRKYLVCYDIEDNKVRSRFFDSLKDLGLIPLQKSVFWGDLSKAEFEALKRLATSTLNNETDKFFWSRTSVDVARLKQGIGYTNFEYTEVGDSGVI